MCGLVGAINLSPQDGGISMNPGFMKQLITNNLHRGGTSYGVWACGHSLNDAVHIQTLAVPDADRVSNLLLNPAFNAVMFHTRAATTSNLNEQTEHVQPFYSDGTRGYMDTVFMQNAILHGWEDDAKLHFVDTDSQVLFRQLDEFTDMARAEATLPVIASKYKGQQASVLYFPQTRDLYMWRVMSPLHYYWMDQLTLVFASEPLGQAGWQLVPEGEVYHFRPPAAVLGEFKYHSIYGESIQ